MHMTGPGNTGESYRRENTAMNRRGFLKAAGAGAAYLAGVPYICTAGGGNTPEGGARVLGEAEDRIRRYRKGSASLRLVGAGEQTLPAGVKVRINQTGHKFLFGCNIFKLGRCRTAQNNADYETRFAELLNYATLPFYWWTYERREGRPEDARTEEIVRWCKAHGVTMKGHPLAWNWSDPPWLGDRTPQEAMQLQFERVGRCAAKFKSDIDIWDVVNEATAYDREELKKKAPKLTQGIAEMGVGAYVRTAFQTARRANSQATLVINDYRVDSAFADNVISQLVGEGGRPLYDVIGIQSHMHGGYWHATRTWEVCEQFARFGKPLHFTETTVVSGPKQGSTWVTTPEGEQQQAQHVAEFYTVLFSHPAVEAITWWDFTDQNAWQGAPAGLVRADMTPKPAYDQLRELIKGKWWTRTEAETGPEGKVAFQGFFGQYEVEALAGNQRLTGNFLLEKGPTGMVDVQVVRS
jgi:endo-1,4-beta-xylanase